jgi:hypothetical protein
MGRGVGSQDRSRIPGGKGDDEVIENIQHADTGSRTWPLRTAEGGGG